jgi:hypothetical protein
MSQADLSMKTQVAVEKVGHYAFAKLAGIAPNTLTRVLEGRPINRGSAALVAIALAGVGAGHGDQPATVDGASQDAAGAMVHQDGDQ